VHLFQIKIYYIWILWNWWWQSTVCCTTWKHFVAVITLVSFIMYLSFHKWYFYISLIHNVIILYYKNAGHESSSLSEGLALCNNAANFFCFNMRLWHPVKFIVVSLFGLFISPPGLRDAQASRTYKMTIKCCCFVIFLTISLRPIISTSTGPIFTKCAGVYRWKILS